MNMQRVGVVAALAFASGCGSTDGAPELQVPLELTDAEAEELLLESELGIGPGAKVPAAAALQRRLTDLGYFPNEALASDYPKWRPVIDESPTPGLFDDATERAVKSLQTRYGAEPTGRLDSTVVALLTTPRCSHPDGVDELDPSVKFNNHLEKRSGTITWWLEQPPSNLTRAQVEGAIGRAFGRWQAQQSDLTIQKSTTSSATITIKFAELNNNTYGFCKEPPGTSCTFNTKHVWSVATPTPGGSEPPLDVESVMLHEAGHAIGVAHSGMCNAAEWPNLPHLCKQGSSFGHATMFPNFHADSNHRALATYDDYASVSVLYDRFEAITGLANDIAAANRSFGGAWKIGTTASGNDFKVESFNENTKTWTVESTMVGKRIAVTPDNTPWVVKSNGEIWTKSGGSWVQKTGCANDIGIGDANGTVSIWIIGCTASSGGQLVEKWNGSSFDKDASAGAGVRIAVGRFSHLLSTAVVVPWVVASDGSVWRRNRDSITSTTGWQRLPTPAGTLGNDIAVCGSGFNFAWLIGRDNRLYAWREQPENSTAESVIDWFSMGNKTSGTRGVACGGALNIAWTVASNGVTTRTIR